MTLVRILHRRGTSQEWEQENPLLLAGERGIETDTWLEKIGNGDDHWNNLSYVESYTTRLIKPVSTLTNSDFFLLFVENDPEGAVPNIRTATTSGVLPLTFNPSTSILTVGGTTGGTVNASQFTGNSATSTKWQSSVNFTIGSTIREVDGSSPISWSLSDIGAAASSHSHTIVWGPGTTSGPTLSVQGGAALEIPTATNDSSGVITTGNQTFAGTKTFSNTVPITLSASTATINFGNTGSRTINLFTDQTSSGNTKTINLGTGANSNTNTNINIGSLLGTSIVNIHGELRATGEVIAFVSDERMKNKVSNIDNALDIVSKLNGFKYTLNDVAMFNGIIDNNLHIGLSAQEVQKVLPEIIRLAPFDRTMDNEGNYISKSGENYLTLDYSKLVPVLIEAIKELENKVNSLIDVLNILTNK